MADFENNDGFEYLIVRPEKGGIVDLVRYMLWGDIRSGVRFLECSSEEHLAEQVVLGDEDHRWIIVVSILVRKIIALLAKPMGYTGSVVEFILNLLSLNGNLLGLFCNLLHGKLVIPQRGTDKYISAVGHLDGRINLYWSQNLLEDMCDSDIGETGLQIELGNRALMDLFIMSSKLAYENAQVVRNVVVHHWKMHFVDLYNCWDDSQKKMSTQVFILCDKHKDANLILISFRGTEPFEADDWSTDFDYSWYEIPKLGKVHMGFLEALGLGNRENPITFKRCLHRKDENFIPTNRVDANSNSSAGAKSEPSNMASNSEEQSSTCNRNVLPDMVEKGAYYVVKQKLKDLLKENENAKFVVTGHSLGGALAILFPTVLVVHNEREVMQRLLGVYTFGQPRVGNRQLGRFMEAHLDFPKPKYFRVVYCNDMVPRLPFDDKTFFYKHFGVCLYYNSCYIGQKVDEMPNPNFFGLRYLIPKYLNAVWELIRSLTMGYTYGEEYEEGWFSILSRILGLVLPGVSAHGPANYVNSVRLGNKRVLQMSSF